MLRAGRNYSLLVEYVIISVVSTNRFPKEVDGVKEIEMALDDNYKVKTAPNCPHCNEKMLKTTPPPYNIGDGLGWGVKYMWVCFNDECPLFANGWENMRENYGKAVSYRCMILPDTGAASAHVVMSYDGLKGGIVEEDEEDGE